MSSAQRLRTFAAPAEVLNPVPNTLFGRLMTACESGSWQLMPSSGLRGHLHKWIRPCVHTHIKNSIKPLELGVWRGGSFDKVPAICSQVRILSIHVRCQAWRHRCATLALEVARCGAGLLELLARKNNQHLWPSQACTFPRPTCAHTLEFWRRNGDCCLAVKCLPSKISKFPYLCFTRLS